MDNPTNGLWMFALCCILPVFLSGAAIGAIVRGWTPWLRTASRFGRHKPQ